MTAPLGSLSHTTTGREPNGTGGHGVDDRAPTGWAPPPDATPERTAVAMARWQRRRTVRALLGLPHGEIGPRTGLGGATICGVLLGVVLQVVVLTVGTLS